MQRRKAVDLTACKQPPKRRAAKQTALPSQSGSRASFEYSAIGKHQRPEPTGRRYDGDAIVAGDAWMPHGVGVLRDQNVTVYAGEFVQGKPHGTGTMTFENGDMYEGQLMEGQMHGVGKYTVAGAKRSESALYRRNKRVCLQSELKPGTRLRVNRLQGSASSCCAIVRHVRGWKYAVLFDDYTERELVLSAFDFEVLRDQPPLYSVEHGFGAVPGPMASPAQPRDPLELRRLTEDEDIFNVDA